MHGCIVHGRLSQMLRLNKKKKKTAKRERRNAQQVLAQSKWVLCKQIISQKKFDISLSGKLLMVGNKIISIIGLNKNQ